jgi:hypothetical protein
VALFLASTVTSYLSLAYKLAEAWKISTAQGGFFGMAVALRAGSKRVNFAGRKHPTALMCVVSHRTLRTWDFLIC